MTKSYFGYFSLDKWRFPALSSRSSKLRRAFLLVGYLFWFTKGGNSLTFGGAMMGRKEKGEKTKEKKEKKKKKEQDGGLLFKRKEKKRKKKEKTEKEKRRAELTASESSYLTKFDLDERVWASYSAESKRLELKYLESIEEWEKSYTKPTPAESDLLLAAENGNLKEVKRTIEEEGASVHIRSRDCGWTPLHLASSEPEVVRYLLKCGADPNATEHRHPDFLDEDQPVEIANRLTPLLFACSHGCLSSVKRMVEKGGDLSRLNCDGETALHLAVEAGDMSLIRYLVNFNSLLVTTPDSSGRFPFGGLVRDGNIEGIKLFINHGALVEESYLRIAEFFKRSEVKEYLISQFKKQSREKKNQNENSPNFEIASLSLAGFSPNYHNHPQLDPIETSLIRIKSVP